VSGAHLPTSSPYAFSNLCDRQPRLGVELYRNMGKQAGWCLGAEVWLDVLPSATWKHIELFRTFGRNVVQVVYGSHNQYHSLNSAMWSVPVLVSRGYMLMISAAMVAAVSLPQLGGFGVRLKRHR